MKIIFLFLIILSVGLSSTAQKTLNIDKVYSIPTGNEVGLISRDYSNDEILSFIESTGWESYYKENLKIFPKFIAKASRQLLEQDHVEAKNLWLRNTLNNSLEQLRKEISEKYGFVNMANFKKYGILLLLLQKIDRTIYYL